MHGPVPKNNVSVPGLNHANNPQSSDQLIKKAKTLNVKKTLTKIFSPEISDK